MSIDPRYLTDWSGLSRGIPKVVHRPRSTDELSAIVRDCDASGQKITIQGGMTGLAGGAVPADGDVVINLERMNQIESIDELEGIMLVQAGATLQQVQEAAEQAGWFFPVDLGARGTCQVGGNAATNAGGDRVIRYGTMRDSVLGVEAVLADGTVLNSLTRLIKNSSGLDLRFLFIGSEGTLGIITRLTLKLQPVPGAGATALACVSSMTQLAKLLRDMKLALGNKLSAFEFMSERFVAQSLELTGLALPVDTSAPWFVLIEATGEHGTDAGEALQHSLEQALEKETIIDCAVAASIADAEDFWRLRESIPEILTHLRPTVNFDCGLPWSQTGDYVAAVEAAMDEKFPAAKHLFFGHLGDNNIHLITGPHDESAFHEVEETVYAGLKNRQATISSEHGIGFLKKPFLHYTRSDAELATLRRLKSAMDPKGTLNPGRVVD
ncbi:FAD-binding oxidoreductase [Variovorax paradoxus]|nr:FAD-binding oxidoreductase [Variovorax paradoxus]